MEDAWIGSIDRMIPTGLVLEHFTGWRSRFKNLRLEFKSLPDKFGWCEVYAGKRKIFECNEFYARRWFCREVELNETS